MMERRRMRTQVTSRLMRTSKGLIACRHGVWSGGTQGACRVGLAHGLARAGNVSSVLINACSV